MIAIKLSQIGIDHSDIESRLSFFVSNRIGSSIPTLLTNTTRSIVLRVSGYTRFDFAHVYRIFGNMIEDCVYTDEKRDVLTESAVVTICEAGSIRFFLASLAFEIEKAGDAACVEICYVGSKHSCEQFVYSAATVTD